ncbi:hypothetical protein [Pleionea sp. CnH1-48]|uniref:hypothetical protein n=1 Tax=Pleionea sp. CnH1-48 TaxID=2954494 RepID=UPI002097F11D|nr:hypothetical protein [Pleionea sp. CnH1-48]MCO7223685.1 hypothetical protein [Pleionea sp. CnH1-48]
MWMARTVAVLYLISGIWCIVNPVLSASYLGLTLSSAKGLSEYFTVYGGLQIGLGCALIIGIHKVELRLASLGFMMVVSAVLLGARLISFLLYSSALWPLAIVEGVIVLMLLFEWKMCKKKLTES